MNFHFPYRETRNISFFRFIDEFVYREQQTAGESRIPFRRAYRITGGGSARSLLNPFYAANF